MEKLQDLLKKHMKKFYELNWRMKLKTYCISPLIGAKLDDIKYLSNIVTNMCNAYYFDYINMV